MNYVIHHWGSKSNRAVRAVLCLTFQVVCFSVINTPKCKAQFFQNTLTDFENPIDFSLSLGFRLPASLILFKPWSQEHHWPMLLFQLKLLSNLELCSVMYLNFVYGSPTAFKFESRSLSLHTWVWQMKSIWGLALSKLFLSQFQLPWIWIQVIITVCMPVTNEEISGCLS